MKMRQLAMISLAVLGFTSISSATNLFPAPAAM
jgi:hypothetical protein